MSVGWYIFSFAMLACSAAGFSLSVNEAEWGLAAFNGCLVLYWLMELDRGLRR